MVAGLAFSAARVFVTSPAACDGDVDVVGLQDAAQVGLVGRAGAQPLDRGFLVAEGLQEGERELAAVERQLGKRRYGFLDLDGVHTSPAPAFMPVVPFCRSSTLRLIQLAIACRSKRHDPPTLKPGISPAKASL